MTVGEIAFLGLVILGFTAFGITLAWANWYERSWTAQQATKRPLPERARDDTDWRKAA
jgi:hypothetical protein